MARPGVPRQRSAERSRAASRPIITYLTRSKIWLFIRKMLPEGALGTGLMDFAEMTLCAGVFLAGALAATALDVFSFLISLFIGLIIFAAGALLYGQTMLGTIRHTVLLLASAEIGYGLGLVTLRLRRWSKR